MIQFAGTGNQRTRYNYCFVVHDTRWGVSKCLLAGYALVDSLSPVGSVVVQWPRGQGTGIVTYDLVRYSGQLQSLTTVAPYSGACTGGSTTACGSVVTGRPQCNTIMCSYTDTASVKTSNYAVPSITYAPGIFWLPGGIVTLQSGDGAASTGVATYTDEVAGTSLSPMVTEGGSLSPQVFASRCTSTIGNEWVSCLAGNSFGNSAMPNATILQYGVIAGAPTSGLKRSSNTTSSALASMASGEIVTLVDSNPAKTLATAGNRPAMDAADTYLGADSGNVSYGQVGLAVGAPTSISSYINSVPDGASYLERLTRTVKSFKVPVQILPARFAILPACSLGTEGEMMPVTDSMTDTWGSTIAGNGKYHVLAYCDGTAWTVAAK